MKRYLPAMRCINLQAGMEKIEEAFRHTIYTIVDGGASGNDEKSSLIHRLWLTG